MTPEQIEYYKRRVAAEDQLCEQAPHPIAAAAHRKLAALYRRRIAEAQRERLLGEVAEAGDAFIWRRRA